MKANLQMDLRKGLEKKQCTHINQHKRNQKKFFNWKKGHVVNGSKDKLVIYIQSKCV